MRQKATIRFSDGTVFEGFSFGATQARRGEVVFNTAMNGYPESLTDPSYMGQVLVFTYPEVGNYGVPSSEKDQWGIEKFLEGPHIYPVAIVVSDYSEKYSHWNASKSLEQWLIEEDTIGVMGIDTRALAKYIRENGASMAEVIVEGAILPQEEEKFDEINWVARASCFEVTTYGTGKKKIVLVDCGIKNNIIRRLIHPDVTLIRVPWDYDFVTEVPDVEGVFISNGPGDPMMCGVTVENIRRTMEKRIPIYGICMGNQLMALAAGAKIIKLKYGHHSHNQPVRLSGTNRCMITSQNHNFAIDASTLPNQWVELYQNLNDGSNEGIAHTEYPWKSVQFHPEACGGPLDAGSFFDEFLQSVFSFENK